MACVLLIFFSIKSYGDIQVLGLRNAVLREKEGVCIKCYGKSVMKTYGTRMVQRR